MSIDLSFMTIDRVVIHTVHRRDKQKQPVLPTYGSGVIHLPAGPAATLESRILEALGDSSHGIDVAIVDDTAGSFMQIGAQLMHDVDKDFYSHSKQLAIKLAQAQASKDLPASKLFIATGKCGSRKNRYILAIKAEMQDGFAEDANGLAHLTELFLTPSQKLFKMGMLIEIVSGRPDDGLYDMANFSAHLFDHLLNAQETRDAAYYFYSTFLGTQPIVSDRKLTRQFFEATKEFINSAPIKQSEKADLLEALRVELKSNNATIHTTTFAKMHIPKEIRNLYMQHMDEEGFTRNAVNKNVDFVKVLLKRKQKMNFEHGIELTAPSGTLRDYVSVEKTTAKETHLVIRGALEKQE